MNRGSSVDEDLRLVLPFIRKGIAAIDTLPLALLVVSALHYLSAGRLALLSLLHGVHTSMANDSRSLWLNWDGLIGAPVNHELCRLVLVSGQPTEVLRCHRCVKIVGLSKCTSGQTEFIVAGFCIGNEHLRVGCLCVFPITDTTFVITIITHVRADSVGYLVWA